MNHPAPSLDPLVGWRAEYSPGEYVAAQNQYLHLDRSRLQALAIVVYHLTGVDVVAELRCSQAVYRRRTAINSDGTRQSRWLLGCPCHNQAVLLGADEPTYVSFVDAQIELLPGELDSR